ncbi:MAG: DNA recombination protein RmuC [Methylobacteriaceae bacterium]|nr:DNA recombination protein RmuC [Methylobacteriaceae bacterium]
MPFDPAWASVVLSALAACLAAVAAFRPQRQEAGVLGLEDAVNDLARDLATVRSALADDLRRGRDEAGQGSRALRDEVQGAIARLSEGLGAAVGRLGTAQAEKVDGVVTTVRAMAEANERRLAEMRRDGDEAGKALRGEVGSLLTTLGEALEKRLDLGAASQKERLDDVQGAVRRLVQTSAEANESLRQTVEKRLDVLRGENAQKLEEMRRTVDEKLQGTLEERLGEKFKLVSHHLEQVHRSVGEMQNLATGVGDLKRVLTNVKSRGTWAELGLGTLLEQVLTADQFDRNVETVPGSGEYVEFAVRFPGPERDGTVWLPIDAKFPIEDYERLLDASDRADPDGVEQALKALERRIKDEGAKICRKYVSPPSTTDFAILYLPTEGLYAEVLRRPGLVDHLQGQCRIMVAGPTNLHAFLTSLRMGFRTLAIEKRSSEVWKTLSEVKTEFGKYGEVLDAVKKKLTEATNQIDKVGVRTRAIDRKLASVERLPEAKGDRLLGLDLPVGDERILFDAAE